MCCWKLANRRPPAVRNKGRQSGVVIMKLLSVLLYNSLLTLAFVILHHSHHRCVSAFSHDVSSQDVHANTMEASYAAASHQASPECWKSALKAFQSLRQDDATQDNQCQQSTLAAPASPSELSATLCSAMTFDHQNLLALEVTRCHMKGRVIFLSSSEDSCYSSGSTSRSLSSLEGCIQQLTDTAFTTFTQFKIYIYQICSRVTAEMVLQRQHDMAHTLTELVLHVEDRQQHLQSYWDQAWEKGQVLDEQRQARHQLWLKEQDGVLERQQTMMVAMMGLASRMDDRQGGLQQFWDDAWERAQQRQEQWKQQSTTWLEQQQSLQEHQIQNLDRVRQELIIQQSHHANLVEQHSQQMQFLVDRHKIDLETTQRRHDELEEQQQMKWLQEQQAVRDDQRHDLERHRDKLDAWQTDQTHQIEEHARQIRLLTERHYQELQEWQQKHTLQVQKHEEELKAFAHGIAQSAKPLLATETLIKRMFTGLTWWTSLVHFLVMLNLLWLLTLPRRCRSFRGSLFALAIAEVLLEVLLYRMDSSAFATTSSSSKNNSNLWASTCRRFMEQRGEVIGWLRQGTILLECMVYLFGFASSFVGSAPRKVESFMDERFQAMEERQLEMLQRLEQRSSLITELLLQPNEVLLSPASRLPSNQHGAPPVSSFALKDGHHHHVTQYESFITNQSHPEMIHNRPKVVSPPNQASPNQSQHYNDKASLLEFPPVLELLDRQDRKMERCSFNNDDDDDENDQAMTKLSDTKTPRAGNNTLESSIISPIHGRETWWMHQVGVDKTPQMSASGTVATRGLKRPPEDTTTMTANDLKEVSSQAPRKVARIA